MTSRDVVVTGIGAVTPVGVGVEAFWSALLAGRSGIGPLTRFADDECPVRIAGETPDFDLRAYVPPEFQRKLGAFARLGLASSAMALHDARLDMAELDPQRVGVVIGTCYAGLAELGDASGRYEARGWRGVEPWIGPATMSNAAAAAVSLRYGFNGPVECVATSCATGAQAISRGFDLVRNGAADIVIAGGADAPLCPVGVSSFATARALSTETGDPGSASRPFEARRRGFVLSEGAVVVVLESAEAARARGARSYARLLGWGHSGDAHSLAQPPTDGAGAARAMTAALRMADLAPNDIDYVHAHATGTPQGDLAEANALHAVFGDTPPPASATKSMTGHMMGAAGSAGAAVAALALHHGSLPPTINHDEPDAACDLDVVPNTARMLQPHLAVSNAFALGGINCSLVLARA